MIGTYYKTSLENARVAAVNQPVQVDLRDQEQFILDRAASLAQLGYIAAPPRADLFDWRLLEDVIRENGPLWDSLERKSRAA
jgi:NitT/TauT family transport system substrate-binding protein